jgi:hypothetical protein
VWGAVWAAPWRGTATASNNRVLAIMGQLP